MFHSNSQRIGGIALATALLLAAGVATAGGTKIDKIVLGKPPPGVNITVSSSGQHVAWQSTQGSRAVMVVDGVAGPPFDELLLGPSGGTVAFSNDGSRYAYFGREGDNYSLIVDGKEMVHGPVGSSGPYSRSLSFSPGGKHVFYLESDSTKGYRLVMDGKPGPWSSNGGLGPLFSPNDEHYAYNGPESMNRNKWFTVIDGRQRDFVGNDLQYTGDGRLISIMPTSGGQVLMVDGRSVAKAVSISKVWAASTGPHYAAAVQPAGDSGQVLYMDGKPVADCTSPDNVLYSTDGEHYAAVCSAGTGRDFVVIDGKKGSEYLGINAIAFIPDTARVLYLARNSQGKGFVVADGKEFGSYHNLISYGSSSSSGLFVSKTNGHYIFASTYQVGTTQDVIVDGKQVPLDGLVLDYAPVLSANGSRYAFAAHPKNSSASQRLVVNGKLLAGINPIQMGTEFGKSSARSFALLSPDGKHTAYLATRDGRWTKGGLFVDDRPVYRNPKRPRVHPFINFIAFTPDSRHLVWLGSVTANGRPNIPIFVVDGKVVVQLSRNASTFQNLPSAWHIDADGTVQFLSVADDGTVLRYRVTPAADNGVQTLLAGAGN